MHQINEETTEEMYEKRIQILMDAYEKQGKKQADFMTDEDDEWVSSVLFYQEQYTVSRIYYPVDIRSILWSMPLYLLYK